MNAQSQREQTGEIKIIYDRATGDVRIEGAEQQPDGPNHADANLPIQTQDAVRFEAILIYYPGCVWIRGKIYC